MTSTYAINKTAPVLAVGAFLLNAFATPMVAAQDDRALENVKQCAQIQEAEARYACYDNATSSLRSGTFSAPSTSSTPSTAPTSQGRTTSPSQADLPRNGPTAATISTSTQPEEGEGGEDFIDTITEVKEHEPGQLMVTLSNGQVWYQLDSRRYPLRAGMEVRIFPGLFKTSWRMASDELNGFIQVKRLK